MSEYSNAQIAASLMIMRKTNGHNLTGNWSICSFTRELPMSKELLLEQFEEQFDTFYIGEMTITFVVLEGEYYPTIFFLIETKHLGEIGRYMCSFQIVDEQ